MIIISSLFLGCTTKKEIEATHDPASDEDDYDELRYEIEEMNGTNGTSVTYDLSNETSMTETIHPDNNNSKRDNYPIQKIDYPLRLLNRSVQNFYFCDIDGDDLTDIVTYTCDHNDSSGVNNENIIIIQNGTNVIEYTFKRLCDSSIVDLTIGDITGDGLDDFIFTGIISKAGNQKRKITAIDGQGFFLWEKVMDWDHRCLKVLIANVTGDYKNEIITTDTGVLSVYNSNGKLNWNNYIGGHKGNFWIVDIAGDLGAEIVYMNTDRTIGEIVIFNGEGNELWSDQGCCFTATDISNDGIYEFFMWNYSTIRAFDRELNVSWSFEFNGSDNFHHRVYLSFHDITGDGINDVIFRHQHTVFALNNEGMLLWSFVISDLYYYKEIFSFCDITDDGIDDVVLCHSGTVFALNSEGALLWSSKLDTHYDIVKIGILEKDGTVRIIVGLSFTGYGTSGGGYVILNDKGESIFVHIWGMNTYVLWISDFNNDSVDEIFFVGFYSGWGACGFEMHLLHMNGTEILNRTFEHNPRVVIDDIDSDGSVEFILNDEGIMAYEFSDFPTNA